MARGTQSIALQQSLAEREAKSLELAIAGFTFRQIGEHLGIDASSAHRTFRRALRKTVQPVADEYRELHGMRLETIFRTHYPAMRKGDMAATDRCLKALAALADLYGLNSPTKINIDILVRQTAAQMGLTEAERADLEVDVRTFLETQKALT